MLHLGGALPYLPLGKNVPKDSMGCDDGRHGQFKAHVHKFSSQKSDTCPLLPSVMIWNKKLPYKNRTQLCWLHPQPSIGIYIYRKR